MKKIILVFGPILILIIVSAVILLLTREKKKAPVPSRPTTSLEVITTDPINGSANVNLDKTLVLTFNRTVTEDLFEIAIAPQTKFNIQIESTKVKITPFDKWQIGMPYRYTIKYRDLNLLPQSFTFVTIGPTPEILSDTRPPEEEITKEEDFERLNHPDVYLSNKTSYESESFTIKSFFTNEPTGHFYFKVTLIIPEKEKAKTDFYRYLRSIGLETKTIESLDIRFE